MKAIKINHIKNTIFYGNKVFLKKLKKVKPSSNYLSWMRDSQVNRYLESRNEKVTIKSINNFIRASNKNSNIIFYGIFTNDLEKNHVGNIKIDINWFHKFCTFGYLLGEQKKYKRKGLISEAINIASNLAFDHLKMRLCIAKTYEMNKGSIKCLLKNNFNLESRIKKMWKINKVTYTDDLTFTLNKKDFKKNF